MSCNCGSKNNKWAEMIAKRQIEAQLKKKLKDGKEVKENGKVERTGREN